MPRKHRKKISTEEHTTALTHLSHDGRGIAHIDGKTTFLFGGLPQETVRFRYDKQRNSYDEGHVTEIITPSPEREIVPCAHFGVCGGCSLQHMSHAMQLNYKQDMLLELLQHQAGVQPQQLLKPLTAQTYGYRRKARLSVKYVPKKEKVLVGFREKNSHFVADILSCPILHPSVGEKISAISEMIFQLSTRAEIPQIEIAVDDTHTAFIIRHLAPLPMQDIAILEAFAEKHAIYLYLQPSGLDSIHLHYPKVPRFLLSYELPEYQLRLQFHPVQFTQINSEINQRMISQALALLDIKPTDHVLDLFCGIGNFTLPIAKYCEKIVGVEGELSTVNQAKNNALLNNISNAEFYSANLFLDSTHEIWLQKKYNKILLDPPRSGAQEILQQLLRDSSQVKQLEKIIYISCNAATLARDTKILIDHQFQLTAAGIIDMFPQTQHVEAMAVFEQPPP